MTDLMKRKIALISAIVVLFAVYIVQLIFENTDRSRVVTVKKEIDCIRVFSSDEEKLCVQKKGTEWFLENSDSLVQKYKADAFVNSLKEIKILDAVSKKTDDAERYGLDKTSALKIVAFSSGEIVRTVLVGKKSSTGNQEYVILDDEKEISLSQGSFRSIFEVDSESIIVKKEEPAPADVAPLETPVAE